MSPPRSLYPKVMLPWFVNLTALLSKFSSACSISSVQMLSRHSEANNIFGRVEVDGLAFSTVHDVGHIIILGADAGKTDAAVVIPCGAAGAGGHSIRDFGVDACRYGTVVYHFIVAGAGCHADGKHCECK